MGSSRGSSCSECPALDGILGEHSDLHVGCGAPDLGDLSAAGESGITSDWWGCSLLPCVHAFFLQMSGPALRVE